MSVVRFLYYALVAAAIGGGAAEAVVAGSAPYRIHTLFSVECQNYFDWQTVGLMHSFRKAGQPGPITRLLSCTEQERMNYKGMDLAPTFEVPSMSLHPKTGDWYPAINKPAGVAHWLKHSKEAENVDWVVILDADMIVRGPILPWELGAEKGRPVAAYYGYLIGCDNILAKLHTKHPELCDKVGGLLAFHIDDLRVFAPMWLSKTEDVRADKAHWSTNITGDIYGTGWISEMYGYSFGAAEVGLRHKINDNLMIYPGYVPREGVEPILMHYGLPFSVGNWSFSKLEHHEDSIVYDCGRLFPEPPYPREVKEMERDANKRRALFLNLECINTINEGLLLNHEKHGCKKPKWSKYLSFLKSKTFAELTQPKQLTRKSLQMMEDVHEQKQDISEPEKPHPKIHTIFSTECTPYFDWQTLGLVHSFNQSGQPGEITRLLGCTDEDLKQYKGRDLAPTHYVPSMSRHPLTGDWYPAINKPAAVVHWINHVKTDAEYIVILDADMIMRGPITPWEFKAAKGRPVSTPYDYLIGCDNELAKVHTRNPQLCDKVGGVIIMHIADLRKFALRWLHKTEEVRADMAHWPKKFTGDIYEAGWISEMYGYSFAAAECNLRHVISNDILIYPGYVPERGVSYRVFHYGLEFRVGNWSFDKGKWRHMDVANKCWATFPDPPDASTLDQSNEDSFQRDLLSIECANSLNQALRAYYRKKCPDPNSLPPPTREARRPPSLTITTQKAPDPPTLRTPDHETAGEITTREKIGNVEKIDASRKDSEVNNETNVLSPPAETDQAFTSMRVWMMCLWAFSIAGFVVVMYVMVWSRRGQRKRGKPYKIKRRSSYMGLWDRNTDMA
ncbi:peptidyl serine alpha-galactosyltransferase-like [Salvia splendens]|uniref:peptidyl serine alpha-galactosyltransferase-like n=1 Tax=Salvia splendens TaxID=180675 RepID=UPI0011026BF6|nr:peptidyl serine alpha-galactosyltransferase-like [Salvia splendens]